MATRFLTLAFVCSILAAPGWAGKDVPGTLFKQGSDELQKYDGERVETVVRVDKPLEEHLIPPPIRNYKPLSRYTYYYLGPYSYLVADKDDAKDMMKISPQGLLVRVKGEVKKVQAGRGRLGSLTYKYLLEARDLERASTLTLPAQDADFDPKDYRTVDAGRFVKDSDPYEDKACHLKVRFLGIIKLPHPHAMALGIDGKNWRILSHDGPDNQPRLYLPATAHGNLQALSSLPAKHPVDVYGKGIRSWVEDTLEPLPAIFVTGIDFNEPAGGGIADKGEEKTPHDTPQTEEYHSVAKSALLHEIRKAPVGTRYRFPFVFRGGEPVQEGKGAPVPALVAHGGAHLFAHDNDLDNLGPDGEPLLIFAVDRESDIVRRLRQAEEGDTVILSCTLNRSVSGLPALIVDQCHRPPPLGGRE